MIQYDPIPQSHCIDELDDTDDSLHCVDLW